MKIWTIGFTKKSAQEFFTTIAAARAERIVDVRLNNVSQLAGFSKRDDLRYFAKALCGADYLHMPCLAPEKEMLEEYKKRTRDWSRYEKEFRNLMGLRKIEEHVTKEVIGNSCLLCSEDKPHHCHRRLVAEYLREAWEGVEIVHL